MQRREFIGKIAASFVVVQGLYLLNGCDPKPGELAIVSKKLQDKFDTLLKWLKEKDWSEYLRNVAGLDLDKTGDELLAELSRKLDNLPLKEHGFDDFAGIRAIEAGMPAMSLLYHALASARVRPLKDGAPFPVESYPSIEQLDVLENYIYALKKFTLDEKELKENYVLAVFAYEYRPAFKTPHHAHADLVFSRTGVARIGEYDYNYDRINRNFSNAPADSSLKTKVAVTAARYGLFLAKVIEGKNADIVEDGKPIHKGDFTLLGTNRNDTNGDISDDKRYFLQPVRKIFHDDLLIDEQSLVFSEYHKTEKLACLANDKEFHIAFRPATADTAKPPFVVESNNSTTADIKESALIVLAPQESSVLISSKKKPLIRRALQDAQQIWFEVPERQDDPDNIDISNRYFTTYNSQKLVEDIEVLTGNAPVKTRNQNEFNNPRNTPLYLNIRYDTTFTHINKPEVIDTKHWTAAFEDSICDGQVTVDTTGLKSSTLPGELFSSLLPAFSVVTAPDFFPQVDSFDLLAYDIDTQRHKGKESNFYEGGLPSLSAGRIRPNPNTVKIPKLDNEKKELIYTYTSVLSNSASKDFKSGDFSDPVLRDYTSSSFLPDVCSFVFAPGWDVTYCNDLPIPDKKDIVTLKKNSYLSTRGLGSPFPEDMKLCAAVNGMWPVASPDAARTFQGSLYMIDRNPTAIPLMDVEIGIHKNAPALQGPDPLLPAEIYGWDGEQGPFLQRDPKAPGDILVNFTELRRADYIENLTNPSLHSFDMSKLRELTSAELVARMDALRRCIKILPETPFKDDVHDDHIVAFTRLWLVSAEKVEDWGKGAKGYGIPADLFESGRAIATIAKPGIDKQGYLYVFVNTVKQVFKDGNEDNQNQYRWDDTDDTGKRRLQTCAVIYVCQVAEKSISFCKLDGKAPYSGKDWNTITG